MNLDLRTMMIMISALNVLFCGLLALTGLHAGDIRGIRQWALGSFYIGLGMAFSYTQLAPPGNPWALVLGSTLVIAGAAFQFTGIQAFKTGQCFQALPRLLAGLAFCQTFWFVFIHPDIQSRAIANSLLLFAINAAGARALFIRIEQPLRTAYWFTGTSFAILAAMFLLRAIIVYRSPSNAYGLYSQIPLNPATFFIVAIAQMSIAFGFVLMLNYRLAVGHQKLASTDALTGVMNRRSLEQQAQRLLAHCARTGETLAFMMIDIDHFKSINDRHGHMAGDEVLRHLTSIAQKTIRGSDYLARFGGEEFCILLPGSLENDAWILADRLRQAFAATPMVFAGEMIRTTISIGIADSRHAGLEFNALISAADEAMYRAKQNGRNRVIMHSAYA